MEIVLVDSEALIGEFHKLPFKIYKNDQHWVPHLKQDVEKVFDPGKNKLFKSGKAKRWLLKDGKEVIGRIAAWVNPRYSKGMEQETGGMGFFECINDQRAAFVLLDTAVNWLKSEGMHAVDGPINFGEKNFFWGLQIENFDAMPSYGMNYNPEYYKHFFEAYGFKVYYEQLIYHRDIYLPAQEIFVRKYNMVMQDPEYRVENVRGKTAEQIAHDFMTVYNNAWGGHHGFKPMDAGQAKRTIKALKPVMDPDIIVFVYHQNKPIAFYVNIPELNEIFRFVNGDLNLLGKLKFLWHKWRKTPKTMVGIVFGVDRAYHGKGIEGAMIKWTEMHIVSLERYDQTILTWIGDFNPKMLRVAENLGATVFRKLATYRLIFDPNKEFKRMPIAG
jgi:hypothetical protein